MGILDRFRSTKTPPKKPRGGSGRSHYDGYLQFEEKNHELTGKRGLEVFDEMFRTDPDVRRIVWMLCNPIIGGTWNLEPYGGDEAEEKDEEAAKGVEWALFTNMSPGFKGHLGQALPIGIRSGFVPFEEIWETVEWNGKTMIVPRTLALRLPRSVERFNQEEEELLSIEQFLPNTGGTVTIPAEDLLYYRFGAEGDNWEGTSLLRPAYKPWYFKDKLERIDVIKAERQAMGVPICYPPDNASPEALEEMEEILGNVRASEQGFIIAPGPHAQDLKDLASSKGWRIEILGIGDGETTTDIRPSLEYYAEAIAKSVVAEFMLLGQGQGSSGARATADVQQNPFLAGVEALASEVESVLDRLVRRITALNFDVDEPPKLRMSLVDSTSLNELAEYVTKLVSAKGLHPDDELEDYLRDRADLPPADADEREERKANEGLLRDAAAKAALEPPAPVVAPGAVPPRPGPGAPPPKPAPKPKAEPAKEEHERRQSRWWEEMMCLDEIEASIDSARERFEAAGGDDARRVAREIGAVALAGKQYTPKSDDDLEKVLYAELARLYRTGRSTVIDELEAQRPGAGEPVGDADRDEAKARKQLMQRARLAAQAISGRVWQKASQAVLAMGKDAAGVQRIAETEAVAGLRAEAQLHSAGALNQGRQDEAASRSDEIEGARYTSILDRTRCERCAVADDDVLRKLSDPVRLAHIPPNPECFGGGRCRCMEFYELSDEEPGYGGGGPREPEPSLQPTPGLGTDVADHFDIEGGNTALREFIDEQIAAIQSVHTYPRNMARIPLKIVSMDPGHVGLFRHRFSPQAGRFELQEIKVARRYLDSSPPLPSVVHETGHFLDANDFGNGPPAEFLSRGEFASSSDDLSGWWRAVTASRAYEGLLRIGGTHGEYLQRKREIFARSYEQWITLRSGNATMQAKIAHRRGEERDVYWDDSDFAAIAEQLDTLFRVRGLR